MYPLTSLHSCGKVDHAQEFKDSDFTRRASLNHWHMHERSYYRLKPVVPATVAPQGSTECEEKALEEAKAAKEAEMWAPEAYKEAFKVDVHPMCISFQCRLV